MSGVRIFSGALKSFKVKSLGVFLLQNCPILKYRSGKQCSCPSALYNVIESFGVFPVCDYFVCIDTLKRNLQFPQYLVNKLLKPCLKMRRGLNVYQRMEHCLTGKEKVRRKADERRNEVASLAVRRFLDYLQYR